MEQTETDILVLSPEPTVLRGREFFLPESSIAGEKKLCGPLSRIPLTKVPFMMATVVQGCFENLLQG
jgi:hypothetical protein